LSGWDDVLLQDLRAMTRQRWLRRADELGEVSVGIHVRRGDFVEARSEEDFILRGGIRTPMEWFVQSIRAIRKIRGYSVPALVVSDASDRALADLLQEERVARVDTGSAIGDLLVLSRAKLLIASGGSSFSAWAAFLGQMPTVSYPGQSLSWFKIVPRLGQYLGEWSHRTPTPRSLAEQIQTSL
ncbi:MAG: alpha-1,2-fucosyltransferase, partial [Chloroflexota bacterium]|nr:alpha-1,2-fucosyltransferase [Chloroflexota bacterium]